MSPQVIPNTTRANGSKKNKKKFKKGVDKFSPLCYNKTIEKNKTKTKEIEIMKKIRVMKANLSHVIAEINRKQNEYNQFFNISVKEIPGNPDEVWVICG